MDKGFAGGLALYELHQKALNPNHKVDEGYSQFLRDLNLIESDGNLHDVTKNIVLSSIEGEGLEMRLVNPVVSTRDAAMADKDNSYGAYEDYMAEFRPSMDHSRALLYEEWRAQVDAGYNVLDGTKDSSEAMTTKDLGGIDLDSANLNLQIKRDGKGVPLPINLQDPAMMNAPGFIPIILEIKPAINLPIFSELRNGAAKT